MVVVGPERSRPILSVSAVSPAFVTPSVPLKPLSVSSPNFPVSQLGTSLVSHRFRVTVTLSTVVGPVISPPPETTSGDEHVILFLATAASKNAPGCLGFVLSVKWLFGPGPGSHSYLRSPPSL